MSETAIGAQAAVTTWNTLYDKIIVKRHEADRVQRGMAVPDSAVKQKNTGTVVKVGEGRLMPSLGYPMPLTVQVGQEVLFHEHSGVELDADNDALVILREDEVLAFRDAPPIVVE